MVTKKKTKRGVQRRVTLTKGDWLDVMDRDGVWNVAKVLSVPSPEEVEVMYDGWPEEYDEIVRVDSDRVAPYHTYTWAVKCWVKYLNWPMWPSIVTIRTPGTVEGIDNLGLEERLHVDFMENPEFVKRDRCWNQKRKVKPFNLHFDKYRADTNGEMFEAALAAVLQSDATDKMPTFVKGTLPMQYKDLTTTPVRLMRRDVGEELWFRNFLSNRQHHWRTHAYDVVGSDPNEEKVQGEEEEVDDESASEEEPWSEKLKPTPKPKTSVAPKGKSKQAARRSQPSLAQSKRQKAPRVKREYEEEQEVVDEPYELEPMDSIRGGSEDEWVVGVVKRWRLRTGTRGSGSASKTSVKAEAKESNSAKVPKKTSLVHNSVLMLNGQAAMKEHEGRKVQKKRVIRPKLSSAKSTSVGASSTRGLRTQTSDKKLSLKSEPKTSGREGSTLHRRKAPAKETGGRVSHKRTRRLSAKDAGELHNEAWTELFSETTRRDPGGRKKKDSIIAISGEESDDSVASTDFDAGLMIPDKKPANLSDAQASIGRSNAALTSAAAGGKNRLIVPHGSAKGMMNPLPGDRSKGPSTLKKRVHEPSGDLKLAASAKPASAGRLCQAGDEDNGDGEEKEVPGSAKKPAVVGSASDRAAAVSYPPAAKTKASFAGAAFASVKALSKSTKSSKRAKKLKQPDSFIEQRIAIAQALLQTEEEKRAIEAESAKDALRVKSRATREPQRSSRGGAGSFKEGYLTQVTDQEEAPPTQSRLTDFRRAPRVIETPVNQPVGPGHLEHSFLVLNKGNSSDSQEESKGMGPSFDEGSDFPCCVNNDGDEVKAGAKATATISVTPTLDANHKMRSPDKRARPTTLVSMPRKFAGPTDGAPCVPTNSTNSMLRIGPTLDLSASKPSTNAALSTPSTAVFSSSEGFTLDSWFKRSLYAKFLNKGV